VPGPERHVKHLVGPRCKHQPGHDTLQWRFSGDLLPISSVVDQERSARRGPAAECTVAVGVLSTVASPDHLAAYPGLAPVARDSGKRDRQPAPATALQPAAAPRVCYMSSLSTLRMNGPNRDYYQRKRTEGRKHQQALIALARNRVDVLWALLRDNRCFQLQPPAPAPSTPG